MKKTVYKSYCGSTVYGTAMAGSDVDTISVYVPHDSGRLFCIAKNWNSGTQVIDGDADDRSYDIRYFTKLALSGQTAIMESLFVRGEHVLEISPAFVTLYDNRQLFLVSQMNLVGPAVHYSRSEYRSALGDTTGQLGIKRKVDLEKFGYSPKNAHHCLRILLQTLHALECGDYSPYPADHERVIGNDVRTLIQTDWLDFLRRLKRGEVDRSAFIALFDILHGRLNAYHVHSDGDTKRSALPFQTDQKKIETIYRIIGDVLFEVAREIDSRADMA